MALYEKILETSHNIDAHTEKSRRARLRYSRMERDRSGI